MGNRFSIKKLGIGQIIILTFAIIIILGTIGLAMPFSSRSGESCGIMTALFTSTSATCVTGLSLVDTWSQWSVVGQIILFILIELGGLGFMSIVSLMFFAFRRKMNIQQLMVMAQSIGTDDLHSVTNFQKRLLVLSVSVQIIGGLILASRFYFHYGFDNSLWLGIFHSTSAFCNAGFDLLGFMGPGGSLTAFSGDGIVLITVALLTIIGGIGFLVWDEIAERKRWNKLSVYTKLVLLVTLGLLVAGTLFTFLFEHSNPDTIGNMSPGGQLLNSFFQSATLRTAGFAAVDQGSLSGAGKALSMFLMFIGGSSGSTAGGLKTITFFVILVAVLSTFTRKKRTNLFYREITQQQIMNAFTIFGIMIFLSLIGSMVVSATSGVGFTESMYECISAVATVGLSTGITSGMSLVSQIIIILLMFIGRIGILTISIGFIKTKKESYKYPPANLMIG